MLLVVRISVKNLDFGKRNERVFSFLFEPAGPSHNVIIKTTAAQLFNNPFEFSVDFRLPVSLANVADPYTNRNSVKLKIITADVRPK